MKLSEAMRKGSKMMRQEFGRWGGSDGSGCALNMAACGKMLIPKNATQQEKVWGGLRLVQAFPILSQLSVVPCGCEKRLSSFYGIIHLNDRHFWSAERIAGWIESHLETPTYTMLEIQEFMAEPAKKEAQNV